MQIIDDVFRRPTTTVHDKAQLRETQGQPLLILAEILSCGEKYLHLPTDIASAAEPRVY